MKKFLLATAATALFTTGAFAAEVKIGIILGFTGPIESMTPAMADGAELAMAEVTKSGKLLGGLTVVPVRGDDLCIDSAAAIAVMERLVTSDKIAAVVGGDCSGVTGAMLQNVARPNGIVMISPSATSPALSSAEDDGLFFRTAPSDARQGQVVSDILNSRGFKSIAITYTNNDYGKGLADAIQASFEKDGGKVTINAAHEDGKADYSAEVGALASAGGEVLVVAGYLDQGGKGIIQASVDSGAFSVFELPDGMVGDPLLASLGNAINGSFGQLPGTDSPGATSFVEMAKVAGFDGTGAFSPESYDAAALIMLAMAAAKSTDSQVFKSKVMDVANAPGEKIYPGELGKALDIINAGGDIDYVGASAVELIGPGESAGNYREVDVIDGKFVTKQYR
ncbi:MAG: ABC transporter substrate-binding protein [Proteobacteria bacterium]|nr:ABC transporter substrate-binding protein [Pseudomonadota bacterium]MDA1285005.1 ABC transporter substrate-binding protein [Pseudomonadota bacterium]